MVMAYASWLFVKRVGLVKFTDAIEKAFYFCAIAVWFVNEGNF